MLSRLGLTLPLCAGLPPLLLGGLSFVTTDPLFLLAIGGTLAVIAGGLAFVLTRTLNTLAERASAYARGESEELVQASGEVGQLAEALKLARQRYDNLQTRANDGLAASAEALEALVAGQASGDLSALDDLAPQGEILATSIRTIGEHLSSTRKQLAYWQSVINRLPASVVVTDLQGQFQYLNPLAERTLGVSKSQWERQNLGLILADSNTLAATVDWIRSCSEGRREITVKAPNNKRLPVELTGNPLADSKKDGVIVLVARDLTQERQALAAARVDSVNRLVRRGVNELASPIKDLACQLKLLTQESKQSNQRDKLLPKLSVASDALRRIQSIYCLYECWDRIAAEKPVQSPSEVMAGDVALAVRDLLTPRLRARKNSLTIKDEGGWVLCDPEMLETALCGMLLHACESVSSGAIELKIGRATETEKVEGVLFTISGAGPVPTNAMAQRLTLTTAAADPMLIDAPGYMLGLVIAQRLAGPLGGTLALGSDSAKQLTMRLTLPSRILARDQVIEPGELTGALPAPEEETCAGWQMGFAE